jgi:hypothetical protein
MPKSTPSIAPLGAASIVNEVLRERERERELTARRGAGGIKSVEFARTNNHALAQHRGLNREMYERQQTGSGPRPLGTGSPAATMVLTTAISRPKRGSGRLAPRRLCHRVMAGHSRLRRTLMRSRPTRHSSAMQRQRPERRDEHNQQQKSGSAAVSSPHWPKGYSTQLPVASCQNLVDPLPLKLWQLAAGNWQPTTGDCCTISSCTHSPVGC